MAEWTDGMEKRRRAAARGAAGARGGAAPCARAILSRGGAHLAGGPRGIAPGAISIDSTAIFIAVADSHDEHECL